LWNHRDYFLGMAGDVGMATPDADMRISAIIDRLEPLGLGIAPFYVHVLSQHPFFQVNALRLEAERRGHHWTFLNAPSLEGAGREGWAQEVFAGMAFAHAMVARTGGRSYDADADYESVVARFLAGSGGLFRPAGDP